MADESQEIFGKIDALLEKRAGFTGLDERGSPSPDFPTLTEIVGDGATRPDATSRHVERRATERREVAERRQSERRTDLPEGARSAKPGFTDAQFDRFIDRFEKKLEDLFIRQQLRMEESIRHAVKEELAKLLSERG